jgi:hypothetical protein
MTAMVRITRAMDLRQIADPGLARRPISQTVACLTVELIEAGATKGS